MKIICLLLIPFIVVMVYDYADFIREFLSRFYSLIFNRQISKYSVKLPKILECSLCMTFWSSLLFQIVINPFNIYTIILMVSISLLLAFLSQHYYTGIIFIDNLIKQIFNKLNEWLNQF